MTDDETQPRDHDGRMVPGTRVDLPIEVHHIPSGFPGDTEEGWFPGFLEHRRYRNGVWEARVRYTRGVGQQHIDWLPYDRIRQMPEDDRQE